MPSYRFATASTFNKLVPLLAYPAEVQESVPSMVFKLNNASANEYHYHVLNPIFFLIYFHLELEGFFMFHFSL